VRSKIHFVRIIVYLLLLLLSMGVYRFLHSHFAFIYMIIMIVAPFLSLTFLFIKRRFISLEVVSQGEPITKEELSYVRLIVKNASYLMSLDIRSRLEIKNLYYGNSDFIRVTQATRMKGDYETVLPIRHDVCGVWEYRVDYITIIDILGFVELKKKVSAHAETVVLPGNSSIEKVNLDNVSEGMTESEESAKRGSDFSDVNDVREYIPGDKLMSIHWKLSAKRDILMVKDRVSMSDQQLVIVADLTGDRAAIDEVICLSYQICRRILEENTSIRFMYYSNLIEGFEEKHILNLDALKNAFTGLLYETNDFVKRDVRMYMSAIKPELKAYLLICEKEGEVDGIITRQD